MTAQIEHQTVQLEQRLFTIAEVEQMVAGGILREDERIKLLEGVIRNM